MHACMRAGRQAGTSMRICEAITLVKETKSENWIAKCVFQVSDRASYLPTCTNDTTMGPPYYLVRVCIQTDSLTRACIHLRISISCLYVPRYRQCLICVCMYVCMYCDIDTTDRTGKVPKFDLAISFQCFILSLSLTLTQGRRTVRKDIVYVPI